MARVLQCGWETGDVAQKGATTSTGFGGGGATAVVSSSPTPPPLSVYCLKCGLTAVNNATGYHRLTITHASKTEVFLAFSLYRSNATDSTTTPGQLFLHLNDASGNVNTVFEAMADGTLKAYYANAGTTNPSSAQLTAIGTGSAGIAGATWTTVEIHLVAATGATGTCEIKVNGTTVLAATSQRTCQTSATYGAVVFEYWRIATSGNNVASFFAFDNVRLNDTTGSVNTSWPGAETIRLLVGTSAGDSAQFSRGGADSGSNYGQTDEVPPTGTTDYVYSATVGHLDLYHTTSFSVSAISAVAVIAQLFNSDGAGGTVYLPTKTGAGQSDGSAQSLSGTPTYVERVLDTDPADAAAWSQSKLDALQIGIKVAS
jgi:hypothetical protein